MTQHHHVKAGNRVPVGRMVALAAVLCVASAAIANTPEREMFSPQTLQLDDSTSAEVRVMKDMDVSVTFSDGRPGQTLATGADPAMVSRISLNLYDYNFDGIPDISITYPDAGMGVNTMEDLYLYHPAQKSFEAVHVVKGSVPGCTEEGMEKQLNLTAKTLSARYRSGPRWFEDTFAYNEQGQLHCIQHQDISATE